MHAELTGSHRKTYQQLFGHPMPQNLEWREVMSMLNALPDAAVVEEHDGHVKVTRNGQSVTLHRPRHKDLSDKGELTQLKHFLEASDTPAAAEATAETAAVGTHLLVVIDHREARVYAAEMRGTVPQQVKPYDPFGYGRDLRNVENDGNGQRRPERKSYYEAVAKTLGGAEQILLFGTGTGASSAMEHLLAELKQNHRALADRVVGSVTVDEHHLTEEQLLAKARAFFAAK
jgi:hypothetical protein